MSKRKWRESGQAIIEFVILLAVFSLAVAAFVPDFNDRLKDAYVEENGGYHTAEHMITYDANGGVNAPGIQIKMAGIDAVIAESPIPIWEKHIFRGWSETKYDPNVGTVDYSPGDIYTRDEDLTLYAVWEEMYDVIYHTNSPSGENAKFPDASDIKFDVKYFDVDYTIINDVPTCSNYILIGWSENPVASDPELTAGDKLTENRKYELYGVWKLALYDVRYDANGGTGTLPETAKYRKGETVVVADATLEKKNHQFVGWALDPDSELVGFVPGQNFAMPNKHITFYAVYMPTEFPYNGKTGADGSYQIFTAPRTGTYQIQLWGADGGNSAYNGVSNPIGGSNGGYTIVNVTLKAGQTIYFAVGGHGADAAFSSKGTNSNAGGWNGGGNGFSDAAEGENNIWTDTTREGSGGGGGATSAYTSLKGDGQLYLYETSKGDIIAVAGGGGGADYTGNGGYGGGTEGGNAPYGGTQTSGNAFGKGQDATAPLGK